MTNSVTDEIFTDRPFSMTGSYGFDFFPSSAVEASTSKIGIEIHQFGLGVPIYQNDRNAFSASVSYTLFHTEISASTTPPPISFSNDLHDIRMGVGYLHKFDKGRRMGIDIGLGSASDEPFRTYDEMTINSNAAYAFPSGKNEWLFVLNFSNNRSFLNYIPLPGVVYRYRVSPRFTALLGMPVLGLFASPVDKLLLNVFILAPVRAKAQATYFFLGPIRAFATINWGQQRFFRSNRTEKRDLFFYDDVRVDAGVVSPLGKGFSLEIAAGYAFFRSIFEGKSYFRRSSETFDLDETLHLRVALTYRFGKGGRS
jgi:hypothetical protein